MIGIRCITLALCHFLGRSSPVSLQNTEGQALTFRSLNVKVALYGPFAFAENDMEFVNPYGRQMEGRFSFALPGGASPSRFAMQIGNKLMEGEVVDKKKALMVYRSFLIPARDPALLEQLQGNIFAARVFPIAPYATVRLVLSYAMLVPLRRGVRRLILPLQGLPELGSFHFSVVVDSPQQTALQATCTLPFLGQVPVLSDGTTLRVSQSLAYLTPTENAELLVTVPSQVPASQGLSLFIGEGRMATLFRVGGGPTNTSDFLPAVWRIYVDTSASVADIFVVRNMVVGALIDGAPQAEIEIFAFDMEVVELVGRQQKTAGLGKIVRTALENRFPLGGTNLEALLDHIGTSQHSSTGVVILSDAIPTALTRDATLLGRRLNPTTGAVVQLGVIGAKQSMPVCSAIAAAGNGRVVHIPLTPRDLPKVANLAWENFKYHIGHHAKASAQDGSWVWPQSFYDLHPGDEAIVFSGGGTRMSMTEPSLVLSPGDVQIDATGSAAAATFAELLRVEAVRAELEMMESWRATAQSRIAALQIQRNMVSLSEQHRVLCSHTAMLVLETEEDYRRFNIPRTNLRPLLVVGPNGVVAQSRTDFFQIVTTTIAETTTTTSTTRSTTTTYGATTSSTPTSDDEDAREEEKEEEEKEEEKQADRDTTSVSAAPHGSKPSIALFALLLLPLLKFDMGSSSRLLDRIKARWSNLFHAWLFMALVLLAVVLSGCTESNCGDGGYGYCGSGNRRHEWTDLHVLAASITSKYGPDGPSQRFRSDWAEFAQAFWIQGQHEKLVEVSGRWITWDPTNTLPFEYMAKAADAQGLSTLAMRAATSVVEIAPRNSEQLLRGAWILLAMNESSDGIAGRLPADWAQKFAARSLEERVDNPNTYRALGLAAWQAGDFNTAAEAYRKGLIAPITPGRYGDWKKALSEEAGIFLRSVGNSNGTRQMGGLAEGLNSEAGNDVILRFTLSWLSDATTVDLHIIGPDGEECGWFNTRTGWGLEYYKDVHPEGLGPQVIVLRGGRSRKSQGRYRVGVKYFASGAMGAARGTVVIWHLQAGTGIPKGGANGARILPFTLPTGSNDVLPVADVHIE